MKFVIIHGSFGNPKSNWFPWLKDQLIELNQDVIVPEFPVEGWESITNKGEYTSSKTQTLENWLNEFNKYYKEVKDQNLCFIGHSIGSVFILHLVLKYKLKLDSAIFVCPFFQKLNKSWQIDNVNESFYNNDFNYEDIRKLIPITYSLYSDNDPYVDTKYSTEFIKALDSSKIIIRGAGHMNNEAGFDKFPLLLELCKTRIEKNK